MSRYCLDTSAYSRFKAGDTRIADLVDAADWVGVPVTVLGELRVGFLLGGRAERNAAELREFLAHPLVEVVETDADTARIFAEIVVDLRRAGRPVPTNDIWIAASAARTAATVLTSDAHFRNIGRVGSIVVEPESKD